jgi:8-oxo-dGTP pyrophosphatase MutT (NUDIX family)
MTTAAPPPAPRFASTVVLLRERAGLEVLMLRRHAAVEFAGDAWVFPGGAVDASDRTLSRACWRGIDRVALAARFEAAEDLVLGFHVAAVREMFEEAGLLLGSRRDGERLDLTAPAVAELRAAGNHGVSGSAAFHAWLGREGLVLDLSGLTYLSRWVTPTALPKRFDAAFFVARAPVDQVADHDRVEMTDGRWVRPGAALAEHASGALAMMHPTRRTLEWLADFTTAAAVIEAAASQVEIRPIRPRVERGPHGARIVDGEGESPRPPR